jgi:hypothetical protein
MARTAVRCLHHETNGFEYFAAHGPQFESP